MKVIGYLFWSALMGLMAFVVVSCGEDDDIVNDDAVQVRNCVTQGGIPYYTTDKYGYVYFITCDMTP